MLVSYMQKIMENFAVFRWKKFKMYFGHIPIKTNSDADD